MTDLIGEIYKALVDESLTPASPLAIARGALEALHGEAAAARIPDHFGVDRTADVAWLASLVPGNEVRRLLEAMAKASGDPHTIWFSAERAAALFDLAQGKPTRLPGLTLHRAPDGAFVVGEVLPAGPAAQAGLVVGDIVAAIDGAPVTYGGYEIMSLIGRGQERPPVLRVNRGSGPIDRVLSMSPFRPSLVETRTLEPGIAYVRLRFVTASGDPEGDSATLIGRALAEQRRDGVRALVLDLRSNPGGYGVTSVVSQFTRREPLLFYENADGTHEAGRNTGLGRELEGKMAILVDEQTLSSAEMIALSLQELGMARVVGQPTAGGLNVPRLIPFEGGGRLMAPQRRVLGPITKKAPPGMRVQPDLVVPNRTSADFAHQRDEQLAAARALVSSS